MELLIMDIISQCLPAALTAIGTFIIALIRRKYNQYINTQTKREIAVLTVKYIEQTFSACHGKEKLSQAKDAMATLLSEKGIQISDIEMTVLLEAAVRDMNLGSLRDFLENGGEQ